MCTKYIDIKRALKTVVCRKSLCSIMAILIDYNSHDFPVVTQSSLAHYN